jgi:protein O-mannosyl-transferase
MAASRRNVRPPKRQAAAGAPALKTIPSRRARAAVAATCLAVACIVSAAAWAYSTSFAGVFVYDDQFAIVENPNIKSLWPLTTALAAPAESPVSGRPTASLSLAINYALAPEDARDVMAPAGPFDPPDVTEKFLRNVWGYHAVNLVLHIAAALALFGVIRRTLVTARLTGLEASASTWVAASAATVFAVHPLTVDAVTYIAQRTEVLMGLCYALTVYGAIRAWEAPASSRPRLAWTIVSVVACGLGMGSKQTMVTAPLVVWVWDWIFGPADRGEDRQARRTLYAGLAATWLLLAASVAYERWPTSIGLNLEGWTPWTYLLTQSTVICHYVRLAILGGPLVLDYDGWPMSRSLVAVLPFALPLAVLCGATVWGVVRRRAWAFPLTVCYAALAPSSSVLPLATEIAAERRMYVPLAALIALAAAGAFVLGRRLVARAASLSASRVIVLRVIAGTATAVLVIDYGSMTLARNRDFWSDERIWADAVEKRPTNPRARLNYGVDLAQARRVAEAEVQLREAVRLKDTSAPAHANLGSVLCSLGRVEEGATHLERALAIDPTYTKAYNNLGEAYGALGRRALAARYFGLAVKEAPDEPFLLNRLGWLLATSPEDDVRDGARAVDAAERAVRVTSGQDPMSLNTLAAAYAEVGRFDAAIAAAREALALAERQGRSALLPELARRLERYEARRVCHEPSC